MSFGKDIASLRASAMDTFVTHTHDDVRHENARLREELIKMKEHYTTFLKRVETSLQQGFQGCTAFDMCLRISDGRMAPPEGTSICRCRLMKILRAHGGCTNHEVCALKTLTLVQNFMDSSLPTQAPVTPIAGSPQTTSTSESGKDTSAPSSGKKRTRGEKESPPNKKGKI